MFLHAAKWRQKEAERLICQGCQGSTSGPNLEAGWSAMELVEYHTSCKEIWDIYHSVYLLRRSLGLLPCGAQQRGRAIHNILSSLTSWLHQWVYPAATGDAWGYRDEWLPRLSRRELYEEALKAACQRVLKLLKCSEVILRGWAKEQEMYHEPIPEVKAGAIVGAMPEVKAGAIAEVMAGVIVRVTFEAAF